MLCVINDYVLGVVIIVGHSWTNNNCFVDNVNDALYDNGDANGDYLDGEESVEIAKGKQTQLTPILSTKCFELTEPNFGSIRCTDEGTR